MLALVLDLQPELRNPGAILDDDGVTFYGDWGPTIHPWSNFGGASISRLDGRPIVQHLAIRHLNLTGYERFSSYILTPVDFLDLAPDEVLTTLKSHPRYPGDRRAETHGADGSAT